MGLPSIGPEFLEHNNNTHQYKHNEHSQQPMGIRSLSLFPGLSLSYRLQFFGHNPSHSLHRQRLLFAQRPDGRSGSRSWQQRHHHRHLLR